MVVILVRRFARPDREEEFLRVFAAQRPVGNPDFLGETLTRSAGVAALPADVPALFVPRTDSTEFLNIARWRSLAAFERQFAAQLSAPDGYDPQIEVARPHMAVLAIEPRAGTADGFAG